MMVGGIFTQSEALGCCLVDPFAAEGDEERQLHRKTLDGMEAEGSVKKETVLTLQTFTPYTRGQPLFIQKKSLEGILQSQNRQ